MKIIGQYYLMPVLNSLLLLSASVISSASADNKPDWVDGEAKAYDDSQYLTAAGSASNAELARDRALANLGKIFESNIRAISTTKSDTHVSVDQGEESFTRKHHLAEKIQVRSDKIIHGARIAEKWKDETLHTYHALALLDRSQAANNIKGEMRRLDDETQTLLDRSQAEKDSLISIALLNNAYQLQQERYSLQKMLKVIDTRGIGSPGFWNLAELSSGLESRLQALKIGAAVDTDPMGKLEQLLKSAMGNAGFPASTNGSDYILVANLNVQDLGFRQGWYWLRGKLSVNLVEKDGKIRGRKQWAVKASALQQNEAESRLLTQVSKKLNAELKTAIMEFSTAAE